MNAPEVMPTSEPPDSCLRMMAEACLYTVKWPFRWTRITSSNSSSVMLKIIRSRRMPATHTAPSMEPQVSTAA